MNPLGPLMAAPLAIWLTSGGAGVKAWLRRLGNFRAPLWVYAVAFFAPLAVILGSVELTALTGAVTQGLPQYELLEFIILVPLMVLMGPGPEEVAFRGHAQHELQKVISPLTVALLIGVGVVVWHAPLILAGELPWPWMICVVAVSVVYAWLYNVGGSVWPLVLLHFVVNYFGGNYFGLIIAEPDGQILYALIYAGIYILWAAGLAQAFGPSLGRKPVPSALVQPA